jgi:benzoyl-CoA reductase/2-hydroxyglutaryl-CoA dehydratase subunit BcrC/BadD/HgdB
MMKILVAAMSLPVEESSELIERVTDEVKKRERPHKDGKPRIMLVGDQVDDTSLAEAIEDAGAWVVMDDLSIGSKVYWNDVDATPDPIEGIAERYLKKLKLPTTFINFGDSYEENLEARFGHLKKYAEDFNVTGVILLTYKNCDPYGFEVPALKSYMTSSGTPVLHLEDEYHSFAFARVKTRIEAFLEMIL